MSVCKYVGSVLGLFTPNKKGPKKRYQWSKLLREYIERYVQATVDDDDRLQGLSSEALEPLRMQARMRAAYTWDGEYDGSGVEKAFSWDHSFESQGRIPSEVLAILERQYGDKLLDGTPLRFQWNGVEYVVGDICCLHRGYEAPEIGYVVNFAHTDYLKIFRADDIDFDA